MGHADFLHAQFSSLPQTSMVATVIVQALFTFALLFVLFQLLRQQGRILLRLDGLEKVGAGPVPGLRTRPLSESRIVRDGLKAGTPAPGFSLPDIHGGTVSLNQFRGRKVLLVFSDPQCGPCDVLATKLARFICKVEIADPMSGYFMFRREVFDDAVHSLSGQGFKILLDMGRYPGAALPGEK